MLYSNTTGKMPCGMLYVGQHRTQHAQRSYLATSTGNVQIFLFGTATSHNGPRAISKIVKWVPPFLCSWLCNVRGKEVFKQILWPKCLLS